MHSRRIDAGPGVRLMPKIGGCLVRLPTPKVALWTWCVSVRPRAERFRTLAERGIRVLRAFQFVEALIKHPQHVVGLGGIVEHLRPFIGSRRVRSTEDVQGLNQNLSPGLTQGAIDDRKCIGRRVCAPEAQVRVKPSRVHRLAKVAHGEQLPLFVTERTTTFGRRVGPIQLPDIHLRSLSVRDRLDPHIRTCRNPSGRQAAVWGTSSCQQRQWGSASSRTPEDPLQRTARDPQP